MRIEAFSSFVFWLLPIFEGGEGWLKRAHIRLAATSMDALVDLYDKPHWKASVGRLVRSSPRYGVVDAEWIFY